MQQSISEQVAALGVATQLDLVDRDEIHLALHWHGLDRTDPIARTRRHPLFFPGDQGHRCLAHPRAYPVVHLPRQQAQGQADHPGLVLQHPLDRAVGFPRVGGTQLRRDGLRTVRTGRMHGSKNTSYGRQLTSRDSVGIRLKLLTERRHGGSQRQGGMQNCDWPLTCITS